jgi:hypothetical protein
VSWIDYDVVGAVTVVHEGRAGYVEVDGGRYGIDAERVPPSSHERQLVDARWR